MIFEEELDKTNLVECDVSTYLKNSIESESDKTALCLGWDYLKNNLNENLRQILKEDNYWKLDFNKEKAEYIFRKEKITATKELFKQAESFVYVYNQKRRDAQKEEKRLKILSQGYTEISGMDKMWDNIKVKGLFKLSKLGLMGSFDKEEELEGTLRYSDYYKCLIIIPKRCRTKGHLIKDKAYVKRLGGQDVL